MTALETPYGEGHVRLDGDLFWDDGAKVLLFASAAVLHEHLAAHKGTIVFTTQVMLYDSIFSSFHMIVLSANMLIVSFLHLLS